MAQMATSSTDAVDAVLEKLLSVRGERPGKAAVHKSNFRVSTTLNHDLHAIDATPARWRGHEGLSTRLTV